MKVPHDRARNSIYLLPVEKNSCRLSEMVYENVSRNFTACESAHFALSFSKAPSPSIRPFRILYASFFQAISLSAQKAPAARSIAVTPRAATTTPAAGKRKKVTKPAQPSDSEVPTSDDEYEEYRRNQSDTEDPTPTKRGGKKGGLSTRVVKSRTM